MNLNQSSLAMKSRQLDSVKFKTGNVKNDECSYKNYRHFVKYLDKSTEIGKCVLCGYKLARNRQNFTEIYLA